MIITRTPFRISFFGGGTDMPGHFREHGGIVLSTTVDKYLYITCRHMMPYWEYKHQFTYGSKRERVSSVCEIDHPSIRETVKFLKIGYGIDMHYNTDIPARSGVGSSSSFTVGLLKALHGLNGRMIGKHELAKQAIHIEQNMIGEAVGCQDQISASFGGFNVIEFNKDGSYSVDPIIMQRERERQLENSLLLVFTGLQRFASDIEKEKIERLDLNASLLNEMAVYTHLAIEILTENGDIKEFGRLLHENWLIKKSLSRNVSNPQIDELYDLGMRYGASGGKLLGAGGGGFMLFFVSPERRGSLKNALKGYITVPFAFDKTGSQVIYFREDA